MCHLEGSARRLAAEMDAWKSRKRNQREREREDRRGRIYDRGGKLLTTLKRRQEHPER